MRKNGDIVVVAGTKYRLTNGRTKIWYTTDALGNRQFGGFYQTFTYVRA